MAQIERRPSARGSARRADNGRHTSKRTFKANKRKAKRRPRKL